MTFPLDPASPFVAAVSTITSATANAWRTYISRALDGLNGGTYALVSKLILNGAGLDVGGPLAMLGGHRLRPRVHVDVGNQTISWTQGDVFLFDPNPSSPPVTITVEDDPAPPADARLRLIVPNMGQEATSIQYKIVRETPSGGGEFICEFVNDDDGGVGVLWIWADLVYDNEVPGWVLDCSSGIVNSNHGVIPGADAGSWVEP